jgi:hypothetical protein
LLAAFMLGVSGGGIKGGRDGQQHAEHGAAGLGFEVDQAAVGGDQLGDQGQAQARAVGLGRDEGLEQVVAQAGRHAGAVVDDLDLDRRAAGGLAVGAAHPDARAPGGVDRDLATLVAAHVGGLGGVLGQVQEDLDQVILVAPDRRQRGIVAFLQRQAVGDAVGDQGADAVQHLVDIDRLARVGTSSEKASMRSTRRRMRSVSSTIS